MFIVNGEIKGCITYSPEMLTEYDYFRVGTWVYDFLVGYDYRRCNVSDCLALY